MRRLRFVLLSLALLVPIFTLPRSSAAESWCADPLWAHEWGVQVFNAGGAQRATAAVLPSYFHRQVGRPSAHGIPVRHMPIDGGMRALPIVHFYAGGHWLPAPLGFEIGFAHGEATHWFPQVDRRRAANEANSPGAQAQR